MTRRLTIDDPLEGPKPPEFAEPDVCPECKADPKVRRPAKVIGHCTKCGRQLCRAHLIKHAAKQMLNEMNALDTMKESLRNAFPLQP